MFVGLYTSRIILDVLGVEDYGVYNAVAGFIAMFSMISSALSAAISRYIMFVLGQNDDDKLKRVFCTSVIIQLFLSAIVAILVETIGVWFLNSHMTIPEGRVFAANIVLQFALISFVVNLLSVPYNAAIIAHEKMDAFAFIGIFEGIANLIVALLIKISPFDSLIFYAGLVALVAVITRMIYTGYCTHHFFECKLKWSFDKTMIIEMFNFAGWNFIGSISGLLRSQGINILFNIYNGPVVNAARGLALQVSAAITKFSSSFYTAVQPQITKSFAANKVEEACGLAVRSSRLAFFLLLILGIPVIFEAPFLLNLWLKDVPDHTIAFVQIIVFYSLFESLSQPLIHLMLATGKIKKYQILVGGVNLLNFPVAWLILYLGFVPEFAQLSVLLFSFMALFVRVKMLKEMIDFPAREFLIKTFCKCTLILIICSITPAVITHIIDMSLGRFLVNCTITEIITISVIGLWGITKSERNFILLRIPVIRKLFL